MKKRLIASVTCLCLLLVMLMSSTLAWFTDSEMSHNTMTVGNVEIEQIEQYRENGVLQLWTDDYKPAMNPVVPEGLAPDLAKSLFNINGTDYDLFKEGQQVIDKIVTVKNVGSDPAWVRTVFAFELKRTATGWMNPLNREVFINDNPAQKIDFPTIGEEYIIVYRYSVKNQNDEVSYVYLDKDYGTADAAFVIGETTYANELVKNATSVPSLMQVYLHQSVTDDDAFRASVNGEYEIIVLSQAMQFAGFENYGAKTSLNHAFGAVNAANAAKWLGGGSDDIAVSDSPTESEDPAYQNRGFDVNVFSTGTEATKLASMCVPTSALIDGEKDNFRATMEKLDDYDGNFAVTDGYQTLAYNIEVEGLVEGNTDELKVNIYVGKGMDPDTFTVYHNDTKVDNAVYYPESGYVTFRTASFSPFAVVYDAESVYVPPVTEEPDEGEVLPEGFPTATVVNSPEYENTDLDWGSYGAWSPTAGLDSHLEAAYTFSCTETLEEAKENPYAYWYCDFVVVLDKALAANSIFLGGNYGSFGWVGFHNGDLTLDANTEIPLLGSVTSNPWTYLDVVQNVGTFICGVGDVDDALAGATFTVMLRLTNPENETEFYNVATINYTFERTMDTEDELKEAVQAGGEIKIGGDITLTESLVIPAGKTVTIDLNGHSISQAKEQTAAYAMIENNGTLTIKDSVGGGIISYEDLTDYTADVNWASNTITNKGVLNVQGGTIQNVSDEAVMDYGYPHAIDVYQGSVTNITGGTVKSANYDAIHMFCNSATEATVVNISGGTIINRVTFQHPTASFAAWGELNITGGTFESTTGKVNVRLLAFGTDYSKMKATISGGTFDQGVGISNYAGIEITSNAWLTIADGVEVTVTP